MNFLLYVLFLVLAVLNSGCSSTSSEAIDKLFGNSSPILTTQSSKTVAQNDLLKIDVNNVKEGEPGNDQDMTYTCYFDRVVDGTVLPVTPCSAIANSTVTFDTKTGILEWTPAQNNDNLGNYEIKISGTNGSGTSDQIFNIGVRLKFNGLNLVQNITGISADLSWTPNLNAVAYQIYKLNYFTGLYELHQTVPGGSSTGATMTNLLPSLNYSVRVYAVDSLGFTDGNVVSSTFITTDLVKLSMASNTTNAPAGTPVNFTIQAFNSDDSPQNIGGLAVNANITGGTSSGTFSAITDQHNGSYTFNFTPTTVGTNPTIQVSTTTTTFFLLNSIVLNVVPGPANSANSTLTSTSNSVVSGNSVTVTAQIRDQYNNPISSGRTITFAAAGGVSTGVFGSVNNVGNGVYTTTYTGVLSGSAKTISVLVDGTPLALGTPVAVTPGLVSSATSSLVASVTSLPSGTDSVVTATLKDANGNLIPNGVLVSFNKSGGSSTGNFSSVTNNGNGTYTANYTGVLAGSAQTISVTVDGLLLTPTASIAVIPGAPDVSNSNLNLSASTVTSGTFITATATIKDLNNNPIDSGIVVTFTKTGGTSTGTFGAVSNQGSGQYAVRYTGINAGTAQNIQLQIGGVNFGSSSTLAVVNAAPSLTNSLFTTTSTSIVSGTSATITATIRDLNNNPITNGYTITFSKAGGTSTGNLSAVTNNLNGTYTATYDGLVAGSAQTVSLVIDGSAFGLTVSETVTVGAPFLANSTFTFASPTVVSGTSVTGTAVIRDLNNNPISTGITVTSVKSGGTSTGTLSAVTNNGSGNYTFTYSGIVAGTAQSVQLKIGGVDFLAAQNITVLNAAPNMTNSTLTTTAATIASGNTATITATLRDLNNNLVASGYAITFSKTGGTSTGIFDSPVNNGDGTYTINYQGVVSGSAQTIAVLVDGVALGNTLTETVSLGVPFAANSSISISSPTVNSGNFVTLTATIKDVNNNLIDSGIAVSFLKSGGTSTGTFGSVNNLGGGQYSIRYTGVVAGTAQSIQMQIGGANFLAAQSITVLNAAPSLSNSLFTTSSASIVSGTSATITATVRDLNNNPITSGFAVTFSKAGGTSTGNLSAVTNNLDGTYTATYDGLVAGSAQTISLVIDGSAFGLTVNETVTVGAPFAANSTFTLSGASVVSGLSVTCTAVIRDLNNNPISSGITVTAVKSGGTSTGTLSAVTNNGSGNYTFTYSGIVSGSAQNIQLQIGAVNFLAAQSITVLNAAPSASNSLIATTATTIVSGTSATITATVRDLNNNPIKSGYTVSFSKVGGTSTGTFGSVTNNLDGTYTIDYTGIVAGTAQTIAVLIDGSALGPNLTETVTVGAPNNILSTLTVSSNTIVAGLTSTLTATIKDSNGNPISTGIVVSFDKFGGTSTGLFSAVTNQGNGVYTAIYTGKVAGTAQTVQANVNLAGFGPTQSIQVTVGTPSLANSTLTLTSNTVASGSAITVNALVRDSENNPITNQYAITFDAIGGSSTGNLTATNNAGSGNFSTTYTGVVAGTAQTIRIFYDSIQISGFSGNTITVIPGPVSVANSVFTISGSGTATVQSTSSAALAMNLRDANFNAISSGSTVITFNKSAGVSDGTISAITNSGGGNYSGTYTGTTTGAAQTIALVVNGTSVGMSVSATVTAGPPTNLVMTTAPSGALNSIDCNGPYTMTLQDANSNTTVSVSPVTVTLSSAPALSHVGTIFTDSGCTAGVSSLTIPASTPTYTFYYKSYRPQSITLTLSPNLSIASTTQAITNNPVISWIGSSAYFTMNGSGSQTAYDDSSGGFYTPQDVLIYGNYMYVADNTANRISKFDITTNTLIGWIGHVGSIENISDYDGGSACAALSVANAALTTKWCLGGRSNLTTSSILSAPRNLATDGTYLYVATGHRILRFQLSDGAYKGWYGRISSITGMTDNGVSGTVCTSAGVGATTPLWCYGGSNNNGTTNGQFSTIAGLTVYGNYLYATDYNNNRIQRIDISTATPSFAGWIGNIGSIAGMTDDGVSGTNCSGAGVGGATPQWCYGGTAQQANRYQLTLTPVEATAPNEGFRLPLGTATDGTYLYISDGTNYRIVRVTLAGVFSGWIGNIRSSTATNPTTPAYATGGYTTNWTTGGVVGGNSNGTNGFNLINQMYIDTSVVPNILYFVDNNAHRISQIRASDGVGTYKWIGRNSASPTGGNAGCSSTPANGTNPGWCTGGTAGRYGNTNGTFYNPSGFAFTATKIYVADTTNARIERFDKATGVFDGWIGAGSVPATTWSRSLASGTIPARAGFDDYSFVEHSSGSWYMGLAGDSNGNMFQTDIWNRIKKFTMLNGAISGYVGVISGFGPSAPVDCAGYTSGFTPTWCTGGGRTTSGGGVHGYNNPFSIAADGTYVYVGDYSNGRIDRIRTSDGTYMGWIGYISTSPTDGESTCNGASTTTYTPGWCIGGAAGSIATNSGFTNPRGLYADGGYLYATDGTGRLIRLTASSGAFNGVAAGVSAGTGSCTVTGGVASVWCTTTATGAASNNYGGINAGSAIAGNTNYLFVADMGLHRINRYDKATGAPAGFLGGLSTTTNLNTASATFTVNGNTTNNGCLSIAGLPKGTPGWCLGTAVGSAVTLVSGSGDAQFNSPRGIWADDNNVFVSDFSNHRVMKFNATTGAYIGWKGFITSTTGITCLSGTPTQFGITPDWCKGGTSGPAKSLGAFDGPSGLWGDSSYIYVIDGRNNRIVTIPR